MASAASGIRRCAAGTAPRRCWRRREDAIVVLRSCSVRAGFMAFLARSLDSVEKGSVLVGKRLIEEDNPTRLCTPLVALLLSFH